MKIELFLQGKRVEINQDIDFVLNKQFTELTDLTSIIVDYSKTIKVPMTPHNNELFNYVYRLERQFMGTPLESITYDPSQKIDMYMTFNSSKVMDGYAVLNSVNMKDKTYEINLYGQLGKIFSDLKEKTLGGSPGYHIPNNGWSKKVRMHTGTIKKSFANSLHSTLWISQNWNDFFGFAPQMIGDTDLISTDCYEKYSDNSIVKFTDKINATRSIDYADFYVKDGFDINGYGEIRSYLCRPYVYVDKIIQMVQQEINQGDYDGYQMILDNDWFNSNNPYWTKMCYFPGTECPVGKGESNTGFVDWDDSERTFNSRQIFMPNTTSVDLDGYTYTTSGNMATISETGGGTAAATLTLNCDGIRTRDRVTGIPTISGFNLNNIYWGFKDIPDVITIPVKWLGIYDGNNNLIYKLYMCPDSVMTVTYYESDYFVRYKCEGLWNKLKKLSLKNIVPVSYSYANAGENGNYLELIQQYNFGNIIINSNTFTFAMGCDIINGYNGEMVQENVSNSNITPMMPWNGSSYLIPITPTSGATWTHKLTPIPMLTVSSNSFRSLTYWTINDILGNDFNPFLWLIDFVKTFRLYFDIDYVAKTITLKRGYFDNITYKRVTVDYSKEMIIEPVIDKYHTVDFGYAKNESTKGAKYRKNYGVEYGDINIDTGMNINNDKLSLNPDEELGVFIPSTLNALYYNNLNNTFDIKTGNMMGTNKVINTLDSEGKIQYFPFYAFRTTNYSKNIFITDDTPNQKNTGEFCYLEQNMFTHSGWEEEEELVEGTDHIYYSVYFPYIPQFDNYIVANSDNAYKCGNCGYIHYGSPAPTTCPNCGQQNTFNPANELYWDTFNIPKDVYNGYLPSYDVDSSIYTRRWQNYLYEIFNVHNNKVTCYVKMTYPEFINFKFNQLFIIDNVTFLVNKIIDFNPNSTECTRVELIEISNPNNLK